MTKFQSGASAIALVFALSSPLHAQTVETSDSEESSANQPQTGIGEIVVTARKREESAQDTPISITALSGDSLAKQGVSNTSDIDTSVPNLTFQASAAQSGDKSAASIFIRGVGQTDFTLTTDPGVGLYLDGVYIARSIGSALDLLDVERIEVLRGPQGTLFGRNTIGGAISITSRQPEFDEWSGSVTGTMGRFGRFDVKGSLNIPVSDTVAATASVIRKTSNGYIERPLIGDKTGLDDLWGGRFAVRAEPTDRLRLNFAFDATRIREVSCCSELVEIFPGVLTGFYNNVTAPAIAAQTGEPIVLFDEQFISSEPFVNFGTFNRDSDLDLFGLSFSAEYDLTDDLTLKSITGYREFDSTNGGDFDSSPLAINETVNTFDNAQFSQEIQLLGSAFDGRLDFILGGYFFEEDGFNEDAVNFSIVRLVSGGFTDNSSLAFFGQGTYELTDSLSLTAGLRWTRDQRGFTPRQFVAENQAGVPSAVTGQTLVAGQQIVPSDRVSQSIKELAPYVNLGWQASDGFLLYASYSEGFKSGGFVQRIFPDRLDIPRFAPEFVEVWEAGFKFDSADRRFRVNAAIFNTDYTDLQINVFDGLAPVTRNAAAARIRGFEGEFTWVPIDGLQVKAGVGYLDSEYTEVDQNATEVTLASRLVNAPKLSLNAEVGYEFEIGDLVLRTYGNWARRTTNANNAANTAALIQPTYSIYNAGLSVGDYDERWNVALNLKNLADKRYIQSGFADEAVQSIAVATFGRPFEWELSLTFNF